MDVLELPRPVINFLRTMSKEMHRYSLCWDIYGGTESVTLTLTWKINCDKNDDESSNETSKQKHQQQISNLMNTELAGNLSVSSSLANSTNLNIQEKNVKPQQKPNASQKHQQNRSSLIAPSNTKSSSNNTPKSGNKQLQHAKLDSLMSNFCSNPIKNNNQQQNYSFNKQINHQIDFNENLLESFHAQNLIKNKKTNNPSSHSSSRLNLKPRNQSAESQAYKKHYSDEEDETYRVSRRQNSTEKHQQPLATNNELQNVKAKLVQKSHTFQSKDGPPKLSRGKSLESNEKTFICSQTDAADKFQPSQNNPYYTNNSITARNNTNPNNSNNNNNNTTSCQLKRVIHHSNQKSNLSNDFSSYYETNTTSIKSNTSPNVVPIAIRKETSFDFSDQPQQSQQRKKNNIMTISNNNNVENEFLSYSSSSIADKNPWIKRNFAEGNNKPFKETSLVTHADKDSILSLIESSAPSSGSDVDGDEFDRKFLKAKFIESLTTSKNIAKNSSTNISNNNNNNNDNNHSKVTFDPKLEFI